MTTQLTFYHSGHREYNDINFAGFLKLYNGKCGVCVIEKTRQRVKIYWRL
jgi:hypothetical protein